jgi:large subunit ribosomal protein L47
MRSIRHALTERFYAWEDAVKLAKNDPEVNLSGEGNAYTPLEYLEEANSFEEGDGTGEAKGEQKSLGDHGENAARVDPSALSSPKPPQARPSV